MMYKSNFEKLTLKTGFVVQGHILSAQLQFYKKYTIMIWSIHSMKFNKVHNQYK